MKEKVRQYIVEQQLIDRGDRVLAGVSGGADSVCLLYLLNAYKQEIGFELCVVHVNHGLRGKEADEDEAYVQKVCHELGLHFHAYHVQVEELAKRDGMSPEEAGRKARYDAFLQECHSLGCNKVAVAHHMNDTAETVLFHLIRGAGLKGLAGIAPRRSLTEEIEVIRPLLCVRRQEIEEYLKKQKISYCVDATNLTEDYSRNKLRNRVIPYLEQELNREAVAHIAKTASYIDEMNDYMNDTIDCMYPRYVKEADETVLSCRVTKEHLVIRKALIRRIIERMLQAGLKDITSVHVEKVEQLLSAGVGKRINLPGGLTVRKRYDDVLFACSNQEENRISKKTSAITLNIHQPGEYELVQIGKTLKVSVIDYKKNAAIPKNTYTKWFDCDKIKNTVLVRTRQTGDYLCIREDGGSKKLKDYFIDRKIPKEERDSMLLLADGNHIIWVLGDRISEAYKVSDATKKILVISLIGGNDHGYQR